MAVVYFYVPANQLDEIVDCGMKLSEFSVREMILPGFQSPRTVLGTLLHPNDSTRSTDPDWRCIKIEVDPRTALVGDAALNMPDENPQLTALYRNHLTTLEKYRFGTFRKPECLLTASVLSDNIEVVGKSQDIPMLYENSEQLYVSNQLSIMEERVPDAGDGLLCAWYEQQASRGILEKTVTENGMHIYTAPGKDGYVVFRMSDYKAFSL